MYSHTVGGTNCRLPDLRILLANAPPSRRRAERPPAVTADRVVWLAHETRRVRLTSIGFMDGAGRLRGAAGAGELTHGEADRRTVAQ